MTDLRLPDLAFPRIQYGQFEVPWDLRPLLYRGGAGAKIGGVSDLIVNGKLGAPIADRLPLVENFHAEIAGLDSRASANDAVNKLRQFYAWADETGRSPTINSVVQDFVDWTDHLLFRVRVRRNLAKTSAYAYATKLSALIAGALSLRSGLIHKTRLVARRSSKHVLGTQADKQTLDDTFAFGHALLDIANALTVAAIQGPPPVVIRFRSGQTIEHWYGIREPKRVKSLALVEGSNVDQQKRTLRHREKWGEDVSHRTRYSVINLRVQTEMLIFISQTGMNLAQVTRLRMGRFRYESHLDGYRIYRTYKGRRGGEVEFEIFSEYRLIFEAYLAFRRAVFPGEDDGLLFPRALQPGKTRPQHAKTYWDGVQKMCASIGMRFIGPQVLRKTRVNWLLRRSRDPQMTAQMAQHSQETLIRSYDQPHHHAAAIEISRFHASSDPALAIPGPGVCVVAVPKVARDAPAHAPSPDCISPAGCLFCEHQRDIDSENHVWSLATYRYYKSLELVRDRPPVNRATDHPALAAIDRVTAKLKHFEASSEVRALWVREAFARVDEGEFHPKWDGFIALMEAHK